MTTEQKPQSTQNRHAIKASSSTRNPSDTRPPPTDRPNISRSNTNASGRSTAPPTPPSSPELGLSSESIEAGDIQNEEVSNGGHTVPPSPTESHDSAADEARPISGGPIPTLTVEDTSLHDNEIQHDGSLGSETAPNSQIEDVDSAAPVSEEPHPNNANLRPATNPTEMAYTRNQNSSGGRQLKSPTTPQKRKRNTKRAEIRTLDCTTSDDEMPTKKRHGERQTKTPSSRGVKSITRVKEGAPLIQQTFRAQKGGVKLDKLFPMLEAMFRQNKYHNKWYVELSHDDLTLNIPYALTDEQLGECC